MCGHKYKVKAIDMACFYTNFAQLPEFRVCVKKMSLVRFGVFVSK